MGKGLITTTVDENSHIQNYINLEDIVKNGAGVPADCYFCFLIKTLVDYFGLTLNKASGVNQEQFESMFMENLKEMLGQETRGSL